MNKRLFINSKDRRFGIPKVWVVRQLDKILRNYILGFTSANLCCNEVISYTFSLAEKYNILSRGDYYEFGLFKGYSIWYAQQTAIKMGMKSMRFFGFDSFRGLPNPTGIDDTGEFYGGQFACSKEKVIKNIIFHGGNIDTINLIEGYYKDSLKSELVRKYHMNKAAIVYIDCDLYSSTTDVLEFIYPLLAKNTLLLFDDWTTFNGDLNRGEPLALKRFLKKHTQVIMNKVFSYCWHGQAFQVSEIR